MSSLFPGIDRSWQPVVFLLCMLSLPTHAVFAADSYHVCSKTPRNDLTYLQQADGSIRYTFSGDLKCHIHYNYDAGHSLPHDGNYASGDYRVKASFKGTTLHEQIWINISHHYGGSPAITTSYTCQADPFRYKNPQCQKKQRTTPNPTEWRGAVEEAASFTVPLSIGLTSKFMLTGSIEPPAEQAGNTSPLITDISFLNNNLSDFNRKYSFSFSTLISGHYEKLKALATKQINDQTVVISIYGAGHDFDLTYKCDTIMDPFLDPDNKCTLTDTSSTLDSLRQGLASQKYNLVSRFSHTISNARREQLRWKALADSMRPAIIVNGKAVAQDTGVQTLPDVSTSSAAEVKSNAEIMLKVESARDIRRSGDQPVLFVVENKKCPACSITDTEGNTIHFPLSSKYTGSSYNGTVQSIKNLEPGNYVYFTQIAASMTNLVSSKKIPFQITSHIAPKKEPVIVEPQENQQFKKESAVSIQVLVAKPMFGTGFDANIEIEHSRLAKQEPYKPLRKTLLKNQGKESIVRVQYGFFDEDQNPITGDFRIRAQMVYDGKEVGQWSAWHHFHIGGKSIFRMHRGLSIHLPKQDQTYTNSIPIKISLPETMKKEEDLTLTWAMVGKSAARELIRKTVTVKPAVFFEMKQDVAELVADAGGEVGEIQLSISLKGSDKNDSTRFHVGVLGEPAQMGSNKMSGSLDLSHGGMGPKLSDMAKMNNGVAHGISAKSINPQPEPPGKAARSMRLPLQVVPIAKNFQLPATVHIQIRNTPFSRLPFELRYRAGATGPYKSIARPRHEFARKNGQTILTLHPTQPGQYQVRFRANHKSAWTPWQSFQVTGTAGTVKLARNMKLHPATARTINPQPEPPGKQTRVFHTSAGRQDRLAAGRSRATGLTAKPIPIVMPTIKSPQNGQKFMLTGKSMHITARISHANGQKIGVQVQRKQKGNFANMRKGIRINQGKMETTVNILISQTGTYRLRVSNGSKGASWAGWTTFTVDRLMKKAPRLNTKTPNQTISTPGMGAKITM